ncbi:MAG: hypothetical protein F9K24_10455 [Leptonema illini]|jgi:hypothetical protein|uniref:Uncharacterized protein n=1 Tax=Leptonema illini TaxID=183 RepID=A0A833M1I5_9LEPT|nr:MAG: hypothetical protein F9K24_10455 [Leptonema illini]
MTVYKLKPWMWILPAALMVSHGIFVESWEHIFVHPSEFFPDLLLCYLSFLAFTMKISVGETGLHFHCMAFPYMNERVMWSDVKQVFDKKVVFYSRKRNRLTVFPLSLFKGNLIADIKKRLPA